MGERFGCGHNGCLLAGGSNGGSEIVTGLVSVKNPHVEMGKVLLIFNLGVYALAFALQREIDAGALLAADVIRDLLLRQNFYERDRPRAEIHGYNQEIAGA